MTDLECLTIISFIVISAVAFGWTLRGFEVDRLKEFIAAKNLDINILHKNCLDHREAIFHREVTIAEYKKRLSKFQRVRGEKGRFVS